MHYTSAEVKRYHEITPTPPIRRRDSSFFFPMRFMPPQRRRALAALYDFCRAVDDAVDDPAITPAEARKHLNFWHNEVDAIYKGMMPTSPITRALARAVRRYALPRKWVDAMLAGWEMDVSGLMVKPSLSTLEQYCGGVAVAVGQLALYIFGCTMREDSRLAFHLGNGLQLVNILRDVEVDRAAGRIYLPQEILERHGLKDITCATLDRSSPALQTVCEDVARLARHHFNAAEAYILPQERRKLIPALLMRDIYRHYLDRIARSNWQEPAENLRLSTILKFKLWIKVTGYCFSGVYSGAAAR